MRCSPWDESCSARPTQLRGCTASAVCASDRNDEPTSTKRCSNSPAASSTITVAQLTLAWLLTQGDDVVPISGTRSATHVEENAGAANVELTPADLQRIVEILPHGSAGNRYPATYMRTDW